MIPIHTYAQFNFECDVDTVSPPSALLSGCDKIKLSTNEILELPEITIKLAFHFRENDNGENFTCDPNDPIVDQNSLLYAPTFVYWILYEMNRVMDHALILNGDYDENMKINFVLIDSTECPGHPGIFLYDYGEVIPDIPNALDITFTKLTRHGGYPFWGSSCTGCEISYHNVLYNYLYGSSYNRNNWWDVARSILHEFGHSTSLDHSFYCGNPCNGVDIDADAECGGHCVPFPNGDGNYDCWGNYSQDTLVMSYGLNLNFTECEFQHMWNYILNNPEPYQIFNICEETPGSEIIYDLHDYVVWDHKKVFNKDVRIKDGTTIEIQCDVLMGTRKSIIVEKGAKLIVNGGHITNLCDSLWWGIQVYGGNPDYAVKIINGSVIENTYHPAVSMFNDEVGYLLGNGNAHVLINNSTFINCKRMLAMGAYKPSYNKTVVKNTTQNGGKWGITNWNCYSVEIKNNTFNNVINECIVTIDGQFIIEGNTFHSGKSDILFFETTPGLSSIIKNNQFNGIKTGIRFSGTTYGNHRIYDNTFTGFYGLCIDGHNNYTINNNDIEAVYGGYFVDNGNFPNNVYLNDLDGNYIGLLPSGENGQFLFYQNCYNTSYADNYIVGSVAPIQGTPFDYSPADNCFTHGGNPNALTYDMTGDPDPFIYIEPNDLQVNCLDAVKAHPNITRIPRGNGTIPCSEVGATNDSINITDPCNPVKTYSGIQLARNWLNNAITQVQNNSNLTTAQKQKRIAHYEACLKRARWLWIELKLKDGKYDEVRDTMQKYNTDDARLAYYGTYIYENKLDSAEQYLNSLSTPSTKLSDFITIQMINLDRLRDSLNYDASPAELNTIETIAMKRHPYAGYAKALYYALTGIVLKTDLPTSITTNPSSPQRKDWVAKRPQVAVYPNPFNNHLLIEIENIEDAVLIITDNNGRIIVDRKGGKKMQFNTSSWSTGVYFLVIKSGTELIQQRKLILIH